MAGEKSMTNQRKIKRLIEKMRTDKSITNEACNDLISILDGKEPSMEIMNEHGPGMDATTEPVSIWRTEIPSEIPPSVLEDEPIFTPENGIPSEIRLPVEDGLMYVPESVAKAFAEDDLVPAFGPFDAPKFAFEKDHEHSDAPPAPEPEPEEDSSLFSVKASKNTKKIPKKGGKKKSSPPFAPHYPILEPPLDEMKNLDRGWTTVKQPPIFPDLVADEFKAEKMHRAGTVSDSAIESRVEARIMEGCLFVNCMRCTFAIMIKFHKKLLPVMPNTNDVQYPNAVALTICKTCEATGVECFADGSQDLDMLVSHFKDLKLSVSMMQGSDVMKAAKLITGVHVPMLANKGEVVFVKRDKIMEKVASRDTIASVDMAMIDPLDGSELLLPHLSGGFI